VAAVGCIDLAETRCVHLADTRCVVSRLDATKPRDRLGCAHRRRVHRRAQRAHAIVQERQQRVREAVRDAQPQRAGVVAVRKRALAAHAAGEADHAGGVERLGGRWGEKASRQPPPLCRGAQAGRQSPLLGQGFQASRQ
jgi:hypothetical protein